MSLIALSVNSSSSRLKSKEEATQISRKTASFSLKTFAKCQKAVGGWQFAVERAIRFIFYC
jgi:hypothetical protein